MTYKGGENVTAQQDSGAPTLYTGERKTAPAGNRGLTTRTVEESCMIAWVKGDDVDIPERMTDPDVRSDVLDRLDDVKAAVLAAARAVKWENIDV